MNLTNPGIPVATLPRERRQTTDLHGDDVHRDAGRSTERALRVENASRSLCDRPTQASLPPVTSAVRHPEPDGAQRITHAEDY